MAERTGPSTLKAIIFDFDGVILESVDIKTEAFRRLFKDYPDHVERIVQLHRENTGLSRYEKFRIIYRDYLRKPLTEQDIVRLDRAFSELVIAEVMSCRFVPGAQEFLAYAACHWPLFIVSGTPHDELCKIVQVRGLARYFRQVHGSPRSKEVLLREILGAYGWEAKDIVFVGDSGADAQAARTVGIRFVGRVREGATTPFPDTVRWIVSDMKELAARWDAMLGELYR